MWAERSQLHVVTQNVLGLVCQHTGRQTTRPTNDNMALAMVDDCKVITLPKWGVRCSDTKMITNNDVM